MDHFLADYYGTGQDIGYDEDALEKMAQLTLLTKEAEEEGIDLSELSEEELLALSEEVYGGDEDPMEKEASDMFETFDFGGRVMAHSMWNELDAIQKEAARSATRAVRGGGPKVRKTRRGLRGASPDPGFSPERMRVIEGPSPGYGKTRTGAFLRRVGEKARHYGRAGAEWAGRPSTRAAAKKWGKRTGMVGGGLALGAAGMHAMGKKSSDSAFDELVEQRAMEHLYAAGYMDDYGNVYEPEVEKTASDFEEYVDGAALQYLAELGYPVE